MTPTSDNNHCMIKRMHYEYAKVGIITRQLIPHCTIISCYLPLEYINQLIVLISSTRDIRQTSIQYETFCSVGQKEYR